MRPNWVSRCMTLGALSACVASLAACSGDFSGFLTSENATLNGTWDLSIPGGNVGGGHLTILNGKVTEIGTDQSRASEELFRRGPDECIATFDALWQHCQEAKARSVER